jgi:hypothetical protein
MPDEKSVATMPTRQQIIFSSWTKDVLIYIIVLNLFVEYNAKIIIDSFTISIFTAIILKILLEIILKLEHRVADAFKSHRVLQILLVWLILFSSKFLILEVINLVFGDHVELGKFIDVILLVIVLMGVRGIIKRIYISLGRTEQETNFSVPFPSRTTKK